jgi:hypothetical protein
MATLNDIATDVRAIVSNISVGVAVGTGGLAGKTAATAVYRSTVATMKQVPAVPTQIPADQPRPWVGVFVKEEEDPRSFPSHVEHHVLMFRFAIFVHGEGAEENDIRTNAEKQLDDVVSDIRDGLAIDMRRNGCAIKTKTEAPEFHYRSDPREGHATLTARVKYQTVLPRSS